MKYFLLSLVMLSCLSCCFLKKSKAIIFEEISTYRYGRPMAVKQFDEAMLVLYNKYPEVRITKEILIELDNFQRKYNKYYKPPDSTYFEIKSLGQLNYTLDGVCYSGSYRFKTSTDNLLRIVTQTPFHYTTNFEFILCGASLKTHKYYGWYPSNLTCQELKEIRKEFETEILPKIKECIDIVKKRYEQNGGS